MFPDTLRTIIVEKEGNHAVKVILILQMGFIKSNQQKIVKVAGFLLKLWNNRDLQFSSTGELIAE